MERKQKQNGNDYRVDRVGIYSDGSHGSQIARIMI
jgi:hypothetical protein